MNSQSSSRHALWAGVAGTALQWYDFALFGYFTPYIAAAFFPKQETVTSLLYAFIAFAVGYLLAPIGALFFGFVGDRWGRKRALTLSILMMAIPTAALSLVPSYQTIGLAAPLLVTLFRIIQGFVASSEFTGSAIFLVEHAPQAKKAFYGCLTSSAYSIGSILAGLAASFFTATWMPQWGWRLGFSVALIGGLVIFYLRTRVAETPEYLTIPPQDKKQIPFLTAMKENPLAMLGIVGIAWLIGVMTFGTYVFSATYLHHYFNLSVSLATLIITFALLVDAVLEPFIAILADRIGFLTIIKFGMVCTLLFSVPLFCLFTTGRIELILTGMVSLSLLIAITFAPLNAYMVSLFHQSYRYSGFGFAFNVGISIFGGTTPLAMMWLITQTGSLISPAWYYVFASMVGMASLAICEYSRKKALKLHPVLSY